VRVEDDAETDPIIVRQMLEAARMLALTGRTPREALDLLRQYASDQIENFSPSTADRVPH
jgi:hypothetical protein